MKIIIDLPEETLKNARMYELALCPRDEEALSKALKNAVPVVRCKDCKHGQPMIYRHTERPCIMCSHLGSGFFARVFNPDWFCADGERRESE